MSPRKIISQELIDWASDDELVEGENVVSYTQLPIELDSKDDSLQQPTNITNEPTNQMEDWGQTHRKTTRKFAL